ncbi:MAG: Flp pilus assembly protein CpaB [Deltaproteobacteria bacterium]|nr:Flp pilus assembly protein CpaB [Deltaproteobacteria bacterium]
MATKTGGRARALVFMLFSLLSAVFAAGIIYRVIQGYDQTLAELAQDPHKKVTVVVAAHELSQGSTLKATDLEIKEIPEELLPDLTFFELDEVVGRVPTERVLAGEILREERLADPQAGKGLNAIIPQGMRAISLNLANEAAVSGFLNPGNYVDVLLTISSDDIPVTTMTLEQALLIVGVDAAMEVKTAGGKKKAKGAPSITLAVTPQQGERLVHANSQGTLTLTLRNDVDVTSVETQGATASKLIGLAASPAIAISEVKTRTTPDGSMMIIRGGSQSELKVGADGMIRGQKRGRR